MKRLTDTQTVYQLKLCTTWFWKVQSSGKICFCKISTGLVKSLEFIDLAKHMTFSFPVTLDSFQSYIVNTM